MATLIIGGCGYVGSLLLSSLSGEVSSVDLNIYNGHSDNRNLFLDYNVLSTSFLNEFDNIILLAGHSSFRMCYGNEYGTFKNNVLNFVNLLDKLTHQTFIYASSASVYGNTKHDVVDETTLFATAFNAYDASKQMIDTYALTASKRGGRTFGLRFGTVNGYAPHLRTDVMLNSMVTSALHNDHVEIYNGQTNRAILGTRDLLRAITAILGSDCDGGVYNLASFDSTAEEMGRFVADRTRTNLRLVDSQSASLYDFKLSCEKFKRDFGFEFEQDMYDVVDSLLVTQHDCVRTDRNLPYRYL